MKQNMQTVCIVTITERSLSMVNSNSHNMVFQANNKPVSVAQLDARLIGDQEVACSTPAVSAAFFHGD